MTVGGAPLVLPLHHVHTLVFESRPTWYWRDGAPAVIRAALLVPAELDHVDDAAALATLRSLLGDRRVINFQGSATLDDLTLDEMTWLDPLVGVVPGDEKADPGDALRLRVARP